MSASDMPSLPCTAVTMGPGLMAFTRMPRWISSPESVRASEASPAFVAAQMLELGMPIRVLIEVLSTIEAGLARIGSKA